MKLRVKCCLKSGDIYTIAVHRTGAYWISLVPTGFLLVPISSHRVRIASLRIHIDSPSSPYCVVLHRIAIALHRIASYCILSVRVQFLLIRTYHRTASL